MANQVKYYAVEDLTAKLKESKSAALVDYTGLTAAQINQLRKRIIEAGGSMQVVKNTLVKRALEKNKIKLEKNLTGPSALVLGIEDAVNSLKEIDKAQEEWEKPEFKLGILDGRLLSDTELSNLVKLPPKEVLISQFVGGLANPLQRLVGGLKYNQTKLTLVVKAIAERG
jgi:large subunit ribosomal protein L10